MEIATLADGVLLYAFPGAPDGFGLNVVAVFDGDRVLLVDAAEPAQAALLREDLAARGAVVVDVVLTHGHTDHVDGLAAFPGVRVHAPAGLGLDPALAPEPRFLDDGQELEHGGHVLRVRAAPGHAAAHQVVSIDDVVCCAGDLVIFTGDDRPCLPYLGIDGGNAADHVASLRLLGGLDAPVLVPGHGPVLRGKESIGTDLAARLDYLERLRAKGRSAHLSDCLDRPEAFSRPGFHVFNRERIHGA